jgi:hypothetical protein
MVQGVRGLFYAEKTRLRIRRRAAELIVDPDLQFLYRQEPLVE